WMGTGLPVEIGAAEWTLRCAGELARRKAATPGESGMRLFRARAGDLSLRVSIRTDPGRVRSRNEDACLAEPELGLYAVGDGMGGHPAGDVAAREAVERLPDLLRQALGDAGRESVDAAVEQAVVALDEAVSALAATDPRLTGMGTTLVLALVAGRTA